MWKRIKIQNRGGWETKIELKDLKQFIHLKDKLRDIEQPADYEPANNESTSNDNEPTDEAESSEHNDWEMRNRKRKFKKCSPRSEVFDEPYIKEKVVEVEFNCTECDFQGTSDIQLKKHIDFKHTVPNVNNEENIKCRNCDEEFSDKRTLMYHRKLKHLSTVAYCKNNTERRCNFSADACWWNHAQEEISVRNIKCFLCSKMFRNKAELMMHRKTNKKAVVNQCNLFKQNSCRFQASLCCTNMTSI